MPAPDPVNLRDDAATNALLEVCARHAITVEPVPGAKADGDVDGRGVAVLPVKRRLTVMSSSSYPSAA